MSRRNTQERTPGGVISFGRGGEHLQFPASSSYSEEEPSGHTSGSRRPLVPDIRFSWNAMPPDKIRVVKKFHVWPLQLKCGATYDRHLEKLSFEFSCKDQILKGRLLLNTAQQTLHYKKFFPLGASGMQLALQASCNYESLLKPEISPNYRIGFGIDFGHNNFQLVGNSFDLRHKVYVTKSLAAEVCGNVRIPLPDAQFSSHDSSWSLGNGDFHIHVEQLNVIVKL